jgi:hypothetical protein
MGMTSLNSVEIDTLLFHCFLRTAPVLSFSSQSNGLSASHWRLPNHARWFRGKVNTLAICRPEWIGSVGGACGKLLGRASIDAHDVEFGFVGSSYIEDDPATVR